MRHNHHSPFPLLTKPLTRLTSITAYTMRFSTQALPLHRIHEAPSTPGIYRWHWLPFLPRSRREEALKAFHEDDQNRLSQVLRQYLISPIQRLPYSFTLFGDLLPLYHGVAEHQDYLADHLTERLCCENRLPAFLDALDRHCWELSVPLYIGKSNDLRRRLNEHRQQILEGEFHNPDTDDEPKLFAGEVRERNIKDSQLCVLPIPTPPDLAPELLEHFANRTLFPVFGRR